MQSVRRTTLAYGSGNRIEANNFTNNKYAGLIISSQGNNGGALIQGNLMTNRKSPGSAGETLRV
jgi:hypothetical protein